MLKPMADVTGANGKLKLGLIYLKFPLDSLGLIPEVHLYLILSKIALILIQINLLLLQVMSHLMSL